MSWHKKVLQRNLDWGTELVNLLVQKGVLNKYLVDIGCGSGALLHAAKANGINGVGFDTDADAVKYGINELNVDLRNEIWEPHKTSDIEFDMITCISLMEHLHFPGDLIRDISTSARWRNANVFISVPLFNKNKWPATWRDGAPPGPPANIHVTHFSDTG